SSNCYISGSVNFGESVEDEWFVVWLLYQLTTHDQNIVIQVEDEDGEFLLIEAADFLPKWLTPENSSNRVGWLEQGKPGPLCQTEALRIMRNESLVNSIPLKFSEAINCAISRKIKGYPDRIQAMTHVAQVVLPYTAAALFSLPHAQILVGAATLALAAFQYDPVSCRKLLHSDGCLFRIGYKMRQNSAMSSTWPKLRDLPMNFFKTTCVFNRLHYARLRSLPTPTGVKYPRECNSVAERMAVELGLKLCTGLDLLLLSTKPTSSDIQRPTASFTNTATWEEFLKRLESLGYFRGELPGSRLHTQLLENAKSYFQDYVSEPGLCPSGDLSDHLTYVIQMLRLFVSKSFSPYYRVNVYRSIPGSGGKRRISPLTDDALVESEDSSHDETISDDSEDGYSEQLPRSQNNSTNEYTGRTMNMADMMRSLVNEIDGSHPAPSASLMGNQSTQMDPKVHFSDRVRPTVNKSNLLSSSSEDDLLDLYGPGSDARLDRFDRTLQPSSDDSSSDLQKWNAPVRHQLYYTQRQFYNALSAFLRRAMSSGITVVIGYMMLRVESSTGVTFGQYVIIIIILVIDNMTSVFKAYASLAYKKNTQRTSVPSKSILRRLYRVLRMSSYRLPRRALFSLPYSEWRNAKGGQNWTWTKGTKDVAKSLDAVGAVRLPGWGLRDPPCACMETLNDVKQPHKASQEAQNSTSLFQIVPPNFTRRTTKSVDSECSTDEEPTAGQVGWFKSSNGCSNNTAPDEGHSPHDEIGDAEKFSFKDYFALMEEELFGEPVNSGRCRSAAASARRPGMKKGLSHRKKPRHRHSSAVLAQPEQFDVSEGDYQLNSEDGESELSPDLEDHVTQNLFTSAVSSGQMPHAPTGAAAQLFTALGIPVHQMAAAISSKASKGGHVPRNEN
ncbi:hypothetical protein CLF_111725, partial [Clonorchis sinensis]